MTSTNALSSGSPVKPEQVFLLSFRNLAQLYHGTRKQSLKKGAAACGEGFEAIRDALETELLKCYGSSLTSCTARRIAEQTAASLQVRVNDGTGTLDAPGLRELKKVFSRIWIQETNEQWSRAATHRKLVTDALLPNTIRIAN